MEQLIEYILQFSNLNTQQIELISKNSVETELHKDEYFAEAGKRFDYYAFILEGVFRICYYNRKGEEITKYFVEENHFIANPYRAEPFTEYIQAATDSKLILFSQQQWKELSNTIVDWETITNKIFHNALMKKVDRMSSLVSEDATTRYLIFLEKFPTLVNRVPLSYIASYLGVTQSSLSRIRKNIR